MLLIRLMVHLARNDPVAPTAPTPHVAFNFPAQAPAQGLLIFPLGHAPTNPNHRDLNRLDFVSNTFHFMSGIARADCR